MYKTKTLQIVGNAVEKHCIVKIANDSIFTSSASRNHANFLEETKTGIFVHRILVVIIRESVFNCLPCFGINCKEVVYLPIHKQCAHHDLIFLHVLFTITKWHFEITLQYGW